MTVGAIKAGSMIKGHSDMRRAFNASVIPVDHRRPPLQSPTFLPLAHSRAAAVAYPLSEDNGGIAIPAMASAMPVRKSSQHEGPLPKRCINAMGKPVFII